jgi:hypothetical protein
MLLSIPLLLLQQPCGKLGPCEACTAGNVFSNGSQIGCAWCASARACLRMDAECDAPKVFVPQQCSCMEAARAGSCSRCTTAGRECVWIAGLNLRVSTEVVQLSREEAKYDKRLSACWIGDHRGPQMLEVVRLGSRVCAHRRGLAPHAQRTDRERAVPRRAQAISADTIFEIEYKADEWYWEQCAVPGTAPIVVAISVPLLLVLSAISCLWECCCRKEGWCRRATPLATTLSISRPQALPEALEAAQAASQPQYVHQSPPQMVSHALP